LEQENARVEQAYQAWYRDHVQLVQLVEEACSFDGLDNVAESSVVLKKGSGFSSSEGAHLIEPRRTPGHYVGGYQGVSFKVMKGVRYHVGGSRGTYVQGEGRPTPIDEGVLTISNHRVVFQGMKQAREWSFAKLLGIQHHPGLPWTAIQVSNARRSPGSFTTKTTRLSYGSVSRSPWLTTTATSSCSEPRWTGS
jgi:hypothetical protein